jgi:HEAT repeat protein
MVELVLARRVLRIGLALIVPCLLAAGCAPAEDPMLARARSVLQQTAQQNPEYERYLLSIATDTSSPFVREMVIQRISSENFQTAMEAVEALGENPPEEARPALTQAFETKSGALKRSAAIQLARLGEPAAVEYLEAQIADPVQPLSIPAVVAVARTEGGPDFLTEHLKKRMASEELSARNETYAALGEIGAPWATALLVEGLKQERGQDRLQAITALGRSGDPAVASEVERFVNTQGLVFASLEALGELGNPDSATAVRKMASNDEAAVRVYAQVALWKLGEKSAAIEKINELVVHPDATVRKVLAAQLATVDDQDAWSRLGALAEDQDKEVRVETLRAISAESRVEFERILLDATADEEYEVATLALNALAEVGRGRTLDTIAPLMDSENPYVAISAAHAVLSIRAREPVTEED